MRKLFFVVAFIFIMLSSSWATTYYYVYPGLGTGTNVGTSWTNAWKTFGDVNWASLVADATTQPVYLYVKKGSSSAAPLTIGGSGSSDTNRIIITIDPSDPDPGSANPIIPADRNIDARGRSYITVSYLTVTGAGAVNNAVNINGAYNTFDHLSIHDITTYGFFVGGTAAGCTNLVISNCTIYNIGPNGSYTYDAIAGGGNNQTIQGNLIYNICEDAIETGGGATNLVIDGNEIYNLGWGDSNPSSVCPACGDECKSLVPCYCSHPDAMQIGAVTGFTLSNNYIHDLPSQCLFIEGGYAASNILIYNNIFHTIPSGSGVLAIGNAVTGYVKIYNNTFYSNIADGINIAAADSVDIKNNIFYLTPTGQAIATTLTSDYNNIYQAVKYKGTTYSSLATLQAAGYETNSTTFTVDPHVVNAASDFHLTSNSTEMIDAGVDLSATIGTTDRDGTIRPQGTAWDIGAYEYFHSTSWGEQDHSTAFTKRTFLQDWTCTSGCSISGSGDAEKITLETGGYAQMTNCVYTGSKWVKIDYNKYAGTDTVTRKYRTSTTQALCEAAGWSEYTQPFKSDGYIGIRIEK